MLVDVAINVFCKNHVKVFEFYRELLAVPEMLEHASPIYRGLQLPGVSLGFRASQAYQVVLEDPEGHVFRLNHYLSTD
jgi:hypothetical protein